MHKEILINVEAGEQRVAISENNILEEYYVERIAINRLVGNIYKGRVTSIVPGIGAAFVDIGQQKNGFLYVSDVIETPEYEGELEFTEVTDTPVKAEPKRQLTIDKLLKKNQEILIQVLKEPIGTKGVRLTTKISLPGRLIVLMAGESKIGISKKISDEHQRERIKGILKEIQPSKDVGLIARTAAAGCERRDFIRDIKYLNNLWHRIKKTSQRQRAPALLHQELDLPLRIVRDWLSQDFDRLIVDSRDVYKRIARFVSLVMPSFRRKLERYKLDTPLFEKKQIEDQIDKIFERKVYLKSGAYIVIEPTEGLVAIDVNTGKFTGRKNLEETAFSVNSEAAREIARQVRLRDLGGIIIIDFIDMTESRHRKEVLETLEEALKKDRAKTDIISMSELDVVEMTRQRMRQSLESAAYKTCPYCQGRGLVKSPLTMSIYALRQMKRYIKQQKRPLILEVLAHPDVAKYILTEQKSALLFLERHTRSKIAVLDDPNLHFEDIKIKPIK